MVALIAFGLCLYQRTIEQGMVDELARQGVIVVPADTSASGTLGWDVINNAE